MAQRKKGVKKDKRHITSGSAYIQATFNNTIVTITDPTGGVITWSSAGNLGFKGSRKRHPVCRADRGRGSCQEGY